MIRKIIISLLFLSVFSVLNLSQGFAYEETTIRNGGTLKGRVFLNGPTPPNRVYHLIFSPNIDFCRGISDGNGNRILKEFQTSDDGGFQDVVIAIIGVKKGKPFASTPILWLEDCEMRPFVTAVRNNSPVTIASNDPIIHGIQGYSLNGQYTFQMFNKPVPAKSNVQEEIKFRKEHYIFRTQCGMHDFMQSWALAVGNPYYAITDKTGSFEIINVPPGEYHVLAFHPHMDIQAQAVTIKTDGTVEMGFIFESKEVRIPLHDLQESYRLQTWLQDEHLVPPNVKVQTHNAPEALLKSHTWQERSKNYLVNSRPDDEEELPSK